MNYIVIDIGCIECQEDSHLVGVFDNEVEAKAIADYLNKKEEEHGSRPQHVFEIFEQTEINVVNPRYNK